MEAICRVAAPLLGGMLLEQVADEAPAMFGIVLAMVGTVAVYEAAPSHHKAVVLSGASLHESVDSKKHI